MFDVIFFDTFETLEDMDEFHEHLVDLLEPMNGIYSFFNGNSIEFLGFFKKSFERFGGFKQ